MADVSNDLVRAGDGSRVRLPAGRLVAWMAFTAMVVAGLWSAAVTIRSLGPQVFATGMLGIAVVTVIAIAGVLVMTPWKPRPVVDWMTMWLAGTVFRMLVTPIAAFLLYSALSHALAVKPLVLSVAATYLCTLLVEAAVVARHMKDSCPPITK
jgi:hypothetical protein